YRLPLSAIREADVVVVLGDVPVVEHAPIVDLWIKAARRRGATILHEVDEEGSEPESIGLLVVSGDEAAGDPSVRSLAERADAVIAISMFHGLAVGWADLV